MKQMLTVVLMLVFACSFAFGGWTSEAFPDTTSFPQSYGQGIAVDGAGKIWYTSYYSSDSLLVPEHGDTTAAGEDTTILEAYSSCRAIYVYNPDGSPASFSPIKTVTVGAYADSLWNSNRGLRTDPDGNVVAGSWCGYYKIDHLTGAGLASLVPYPRADHGPAGNDWNGESITAASFDDEGNMFVCTVLPGFPIKAFDSDWELIDDVVAADNHIAYSRTIEVSADGNDIYYCGFTAGVGYIRFHSDAGVDGDYMTTVDTLFPGLSVEAVGWDPNGYIWGGNTGGSGFTNCGFYAYDPVTDALVDSLFVPGAADLGAKPRGIDFSADGNNAYVTFFNSWDTEAIYKLTKTGAGVWETDLVIANGFTLGKNYPNPFNPNTIIPFDIYQTNDVKLTIYDITGREVQTLVNETLSPNHYEIEFGGSELATGSYFYRLSVGGKTITNMMTLLK
ncbi:MAG: T9SS type A sorting domain-containing protein [Candidatus Marinimicrobia bacterium]|nr:T9SS type A sorting domain-containing protein [Candidatus Neomarinimicrobiota bacterium]